MIPRKLTLIEIDDDPADLTARFEGYYQHVKIRSITGATEHVVDDKRRGWTSGDLFVVDVNFERDVPVSGMSLDWGNPPTTREEDQVFPYGLLLALPFLASSATSVFVPYSASWTKTGVLNNGMLAVAFSIINAAVRDEENSFSEGLEAFRAAVSDPDTPRVPADAAHIAAHQYRHRLRQRSLRGKGPAWLIRPSETHDQLLDLENALEASGTAADIPLRTPSGETIALEVLYQFDDGPNVSRTDVIEIASLYADVLDYSRTAVAAQIRRVREDLSNWIDASNVDDPDPILHVLQQVNEKWDLILANKFDIRSIVSRKESAQPPANETSHAQRSAQQVRHLHNMAWLKALYLRSRGLMERRSIVPEVRRLLNLDPNYKLHRLFWPDDNKVPRPDEVFRAFRQPYRRDAGATLEHYHQLRMSAESGQESEAPARPFAYLWGLDGSEESVRLSDEERYILQVFARKKLRWTNTLEHPWPDWLQ